MRKKVTGFDILLDTFAVGPLWMGPVIALVAFPVVRYFIPYILYHGPTNNQVATASFQMLANIARSFAPIFTFLLLAIWAAARVKKWADRRRLDTTETLEDVHQLSWQAFEGLVAEAFRRRGYTVEETGGGSGDGGVDLILNRDGERTLVQCKQWRNRQVGVKVVRELYGVMHDEGAKKGTIVCCGNFTPEAEAFADRNNITIITGRELEEIIASVRLGTPPRAEPQQLPERKSAIRPNSASPSCPICQTPMVLRTATKGANAGSKFWGCTKYPRCRGIRQL